jgi:hypothetical protein
MIYLFNEAKAKLTTKEGLHLHTTKFASIRGPQNETVHINDALAIDE